MIIERATCLHHLFEASVDRRPRAPAIISGRTTLTYQEVEARANQRARQLRSHGVKTGDRVGLLVDRSADAVVAILSILKAGAAYVPLDSSHPVERIRHVVEDSGIVALVSETNKRGLTQGLRRGSIEIDDPTRAADAAAATRLSREEIDVTAADLSYVLYTSGSTGRPKGVMTEHRNAVSFVNAFNQVIELTDEDRVFHGFSIGFDGSVEEIWMAFSNGAALVVPARRGPPRADRGRHDSGAVGNELARLITQGKATVFSTVPTSLSMISDPLPTVRLLIVSGERCPPEAVNRWATAERRMLNVYGPTETTVNATAAECRPGAPVTIGSPLPGYKVHVVDDKGRRVAVGQRGELFISGPGVARGYLNQPELTEERFVELPSQLTEGLRAYRTGDLVSFSENGELLFHGRIDDQIKLRGFRIEPSEIEAVLGELDSVRTAVVTAVERDGTSALAAYVVPKDRARAIDRGAVLSVLKRRLPSYMVPSFLDIVDALPALSSGKVDRKSLPPPQSPLIGRERAVLGPGSELESILLCAFGRVVASDAISIDDDFFVSLGGYSLLAARLVSDLRQEAKLEISIRDVYDHPTVQALAAHLTSKGVLSVADNPASGRRAARPSSRRAFHGVPRATRAACMASQALALYWLYGVLSLPCVGFWLSLTRWRHGALSSSSFAALWLFITAGTWPLLLALSVAVKWVVIGRYQPGSYPVWGWYYFRFWLVRRFEIIALPNLLVGTPLLPFYYRFLGAKIGKRCTIDTVQCAVFDLLTIGDDSSIGRETQLLGYRVEDGYLHIGSVEIGKGCFVGIHSAVGTNVRMGDDARLDDLSLLPDGATMLRGETRRGSPARPGDVPVPQQPIGTSMRRRTMLFGVLHILTLYGLGLSLLPAGIPSGAILYYAEESGNPFWLIASIPAAGVAGIVAFCLWVAFLKRAFLPRLRPGVYRVDSAYYLREWASSFLMQASRAIAKPVYSTIYFPAWLRLLGAKIGRRAEISTVSQIAPDLTDLGEQSFFADGSMVAGRRVHRGLLELTESRVGRRSFVGNSAILPVRATLGDGCLIGCLSAPPIGRAPVPDGTEWLGSPSFSLPHRQKIEGFDESVTHEPTRKLFAMRLAVDALRVALPSTIVTAELWAFGELLAYAHERLSFALWLVATPLMAMAVAAAGLASVVVTKKALIGTFRPIVKPLWSMFVWLNEVVNGTYESVAAPLLLPLLGTPYCAPWLRLLGCQIGRHVYLETTLFSEFDLVHIGDYAALNVGAVIQNHLFEDRIMKASVLEIGDECSVGNMAVVLYDTEMQTGSSIGPLSLLMKGETLPPGTRWLGIPTAQIPPTTTAPAAVTAAVEVEARLLHGWL